MPIVMTRIDDRLLHGQVSLGWGATLCADVVIVADDRAAADPWEREVYEASGPEGAEVRVLDEATAAGHFAGWQAGDQRIFVLVRDLGAFVRLLDAGCPVGDVVNVGGLHAKARSDAGADAGADARTERGFGYSLSDADVDRIRDIEGRGVRCEFRPLPADPPRDVADVLDEGTRT